MSASVLVAYATRYGSTQEVAEAVAATLREGKLEVEIQPMLQVQVCAPGCSRVASRSWQIERFADAKEERPSSGSGN